MKEKINLVCLCEEIFTFLITFTSRKVMSVDQVQTSTILQQKFRKYNKTEDLLIELDKSVYFFRFFHFVLDRRQSEKKLFSRRK